MSKIEPLLACGIFNSTYLENQPLTNDNNSSVFSNAQFNSTDFNNLNNAISELFASDILLAFKVLKHLSSHSKTLIILGSNGSGKTSLANYLKNVETHVKVIPASKPIKTMGDVRFMYDSTVDTYMNTIFQGGDLKEDLLQKLIIGLCTEHDDVTRKDRDTGNKTKEKTIFEKVKNIFEDFFDVELDNSRFGNKEIWAKKSGSDLFPFNNMSDGERVGFFYIATVMVAPRQSFIIVDEPENYLNPAIYNKIWDRLIEVRNDCQFIFISHTMEFIDARTNFELVKIKQFTYPDKFEFEFLGNTLDDLNPDVIVEVVGSREPILFCEGSKTSNDYKVYETLFGDRYTVIPTGNGASVKDSVKACNEHAAIYNIQKSIGIIDSDLKSVKEINRLKTTHIYVLECNEIEMLLLDEAIFKKVLAHQYIEDSESKFENFKTNFFKKLKERKEYIIKRFVKTQIDEKLNTSVIDDKRNKTQQEFKENIENILREIDVAALWSACNEKITDIVVKKDYEAALKFCCLAHGEVIGGLTNDFVPNYTIIALGVLKDDKRLAQAIRDKYFAKFEQML